MTARDIQRAIMACRYRRSMCLPNYTPINWFECDVFELTKAGFMREYEIKLSLADFRADRTKAKTEWVTNHLPNGRFTFDQKLGRPKHDQLAGTALRGPSRFYFVAPYGLLMIEQIPEWAGFITARKMDGWNSLRMTMEREAPQLHRCRALPEVRDHAGSVCYWRYLELLMKGKSL